MQALSSLPFAVEAKSISKWIDTLTLNQPIQAANDVHKVLKALTKNPVQYQPYIDTILTELTPITILLSLELERLFCSQEEILDTKKRKIARLSMNLLRYQALLYYQLSAYVDKEKLDLCINRCVQTSYLYLKQSALIYDLPSKELWEVIGKMYHLASTEELLDLSINDPLPFFKKQRCINNSIKTVLLFNLCKPCYLKQYEISTLSTLLEQYSSQLLLTDLYTTTCSHSWCYENAYGVELITPYAPVSNNTIFLDINLIIPILQSKDFSLLADRLIIHQALIPSLSKISGHKARAVYNDFDTVIKALEQSVAPVNINTTTRRSLSPADKLELQPFDYEKIIEKTPPHEIWERNKTQKTILNEVIIKENSNLNYSLVELDAFSGKSERLILIFGREKIPQLGIIRYVEITAHNIYQLFVEKINSSAKVVTLIYLENKFQAIHYKTAHNLTFLLVSPKQKYSIGSTVTIVNQDFMLNKLLENTSSFILYQTQQIDSQHHEEHVL